MALSGIAATMATLLADRFLRSIHGVTVDLASGGEVTIRVARTGSPSEQERWAARCAALYGCRHPHLVELVDFGLIERHDRFEAYRLAAPPVSWARRDGETAGALRAAVAFLHRLGLSAGLLAWTRVVDGDGALQLVPDVDTGSLAVEGGQNPTIEREVESLGLMLKSCRGGQADTAAYVG